MKNNRKRLVVSKELCSFASWMDRYLIILLLTQLMSFYFPVNMEAARGDSILLAEIKQLKDLYMDGKKDSAIVRSRELLSTPDAQKSYVAQLILHSTIAICLSDKDKKAASEEYLECVTIAEGHGMMAKAEKTQDAYLFTTMLNVYYQLAIYFDDLDMKKETLLFAKCGMEWLALCEDRNVRAQVIPGYAIILMKYKEYSMIYEPMKEAMPILLKMNKPDYALIVAAYLTMIEYQKFGMDPKDIPWITVGEQLMGHAKTYQAKTTFQNATRLLIAHEDKTADGNGQQMMPDSSDITLAPTTAEADSLASDSIQTRIEYVHQRNERIGIFMGLLVFVTFGFIIYVIWQRRQRKRREYEAEQLMEERYIEGQEDERSRLARELHDGVSNQLLAVEMKLNSDGLTPQTMQLLNESREQVRRVSHELIPPDFSHSTLDQNLSCYASQMNGARHCEVSYGSSPENADWSVIPDKTALEIYRIVQEVVSNVLKHSEATVLSIGMHLEDESSLSVIISDNSTSDIQPISTTGIGNRTIYQRASSIGGTIKTHHHPYGNVVQLTVYHHFLSKT